MEQEQTAAKPARFSVAGVLLILVGVLLILSRVHVLHLGWGNLIWTFLLVYAVVVVVRGFARRRAAAVFFGSLLFFVSLHAVLQLWGVALFGFAEWIPNIALALGLSFLVLYILEPRNVGLLIPFILFAGFGAVYYLWWWDMVDLFDVKQYAATYWPLLLVLFGISVMLKKRT
ncbi:MAG: hypothetical protein WBD36_12855 [Bacteroidota bacterium]